MIEVTITSRAGTRELGHVRIENVKMNLDDGTADYVIELGVDTAEGFAVYQRNIERFPRKNFNALALLRQALNTLEEEELTLDGDPDDPSTSSYPSNLARELGGAM